MYREIFDYVAKILSTGREYFTGGFVSKPRTASLSRGIYFIKNKVEIFY